MVATHSRYWWGSGIISNHVPFTNFRGVNVMPCCTECGIQVSNLRKHLQRRRCNKQHQRETGVKKVKV